MPAERPAMRDDEGVEPPPSPRAASVLRVLRSPTLVVLLTALAVGLAIQSALERQWNLFIWWVALCVASVANEVRRRRRLRR